MRREPPTSIHLLESEHAEELLRFELDNRAFFERSLPGRGDAYFTLPNVRTTIHRFLQERANGTTFMYLIRNATWELVGRINLSVVPDATGVADLGYRIGERHQGCGHASRAVALVTRLAFGHHAMERLVAMTTPQNVGSQIVLLRNGFEFKVRKPNDLRLHGVDHDSLHFELERRS